MVETESKADMNDAAIGRKILLVKKCPLSAYAIETFLAAIDSTLTVVTCDCAESALAHVHGSRSWFRLFVGIDVPGAYGLTLVRQLAHLGIAEHCAIVTDIENSQWQAEASRMGLLGYILKSKSLAQFKASLAAVVDGQQVFSARRDEHASQTVQLTRRQRDVLDLLHRGYSSKKIAAQLMLSVGTVDNHVTSILRSFKVYSRTHAIAKAIELGHLVVACQSRALALEWSC